jgi:DNA ligase-1
MPVTLEAVVTASAAIAATRSRIAKREALAEVLGTADARDLPLVVSYLSGAPRQDRLGVGWSALAGAVAEPSPAAGLTLSDVDGIFEEIAATSGPGSRSRRDELLVGLFSQATAEEQDFLRRLILRDLRQGATEGLMIEGIAEAADVSPAAVRRAAMLSGSVVDAGLAALRGGTDALGAIGLRVGTPVQPMLAATAEDVTSALEGLETAAVEAKLDGARVQVHVSERDVLIVTRNLNDVTDRMPEVVALLDGIPFTSLILDGEVIALGPTERPLPFQETMGRFGTERDDGDQVGAVPLTPYFFDVLHADGADLIDRPLAERLAVLDRLPGEMVMPRIETVAPAAAQQFFDDIIARGHEGVMVKDLAAPYAAGRRGSAWRKVKPVHTLDLVVLAVEWGSGRRRGWLSNLHLGARDPDGGFVMLGKTFKGLTDEMLQWQTDRFLELETHREGHVVHVRPEQVVEIALDGVQASSRYPAGMALRFARVKGYRPDKTAADADTVETVRAIFDRSL